MRARAPVTLPVARPVRPPAARRCAPLTPHLAPRVPPAASLPREDQVTAQHVDSIMTGITALLDDYRLLRSVRRGLGRAPAACFALTRTLVLRPVPGQPARPYPAADSRRAHVGCRSEDAPR